MMLTQRYKYTLIAFIVALALNMAYYKIVVIQKCPSSGAPPKKFLDILILSLPMSLLVAIVAYYVSPQGPPAFPASVPSAPPVNGTMPPVNYGRNNMALKNRPYSG